MTASYEKHSTSAKLPERMRNSFCAAPWVQSHISADGRFRHCCVAEATPGSHRASSFEEYYNSEDVRAARRQMLSGTLPAECFRCQKSNRVVSDRESLNEKHKVVIDQILTSTAPDGSVSKPMIREIDHRSIVCNLSCLTCGSHSSTRWARWIESDSELSAVDNLCETLANTKKYLSFRTYERESQRIIRHQEQIEMIYFAGGEPLLARHHDATLDFLLDSERSANIELFYNTNLCLPENKIRSWVSKLGRFKGSQIYASFDGSPELSSFIRTYSDVQLFQKNFDLIRSCGVSNLRIMLDVTITSLLFLDLDRFVDFVLQNQYVVISKLMLGHGSAGGFLNVEALPLRERQRVYRSFSERFQQLTWDQKILLDQFDKTLKHGLEKPAWPTHEKTHFKGMIDLYERKANRIGFVASLDRDGALFS